MATNPFVFANPTQTADDFNSFSAAQVDADHGIDEIEQLEAIPAPRLSPPVLDLGAVLGTDAVSAITASGNLVFHAAGDTGGIINPAPQFAVADALAGDLDGKTYASGQPAFFFHLGDVVYYFGQEEYYPEQFYDPYRNYDAPIFAIPGNHDGVLYKNEPVDYSLQPFVENFCTAAPEIAVPSFARTTMTQPGVYFTLTAPFARIIGLYSNTSEDGGVLGNSTIGNDQVTFLQNQLAAALQARNANPGSPFALIIAVHHPPFTGSSEHFPSAAMLAQIDSCCQQTGIWPDLVLSGHAHLYERYTRTMQSDGRQIPYVVAGNGGYYNLSKLKTNAQGQKPTAGQHSEPDGQGNTISLDQYNDTGYGFLRITVSAASILVEALTIAVGSTAAPTLIDQFTVSLSAHTVTGGATSNTTKKKAKKGKSSARKAAKTATAKRQAKTKSTPQASRKPKRGGPAKKAKRKK